MNATPRAAPPPEGLPFSRAYELSVSPHQSPWLVEGLWAEQAVGILGGEPKCCKSFLAMDMAVSVASGAPCLRRFPVRRTGSVLMFPAEDALAAVRQRLEGICAAAQARLQDLPIYVITSPRLLLDLPQDRDRLRETVAALQPTLLVLDPFIRLHRADENASKEVAPLLGYLRELQREFHVAVVLVHHVRKRSGKDRPGQALRGSSDLHGWGDSNLYLRRQSTHLVLSIEHRAAAAADDVDLELVTNGSALALAARDLPPVEAEAKQPASASERILQALQEATLPMSTQQLRKRCALRTTTLCETLNLLSQAGRIVREPKGYSLPAAVSISAPPIGSTGNGNGKQPASAALLHELPLFSGETQAGSAGTQPAQG